MWGPKLTSRCLGVRGFLRVAKQTQFLGKRRDRIENTSREKRKHLEKVVADLPGGKFSNMAERVNWH